MVVKIREIYNDDYDYEAIWAEYEKHIKEEFTEEDATPTFENYLENLQDDTYNLFIEEILEKDAFNNVLFIGYVHLWNGKRNAVKYFETTQDFINTVFNGNYNVKIYFEGKRLFIQLAHHDGTNFFEIRELSKKGEARKEKIEEAYEDFEEVVLDKYDAWKDTYSKVYGRKIFD